MASKIPLRRGGHMVRPPVIPGWVRASRDAFKTEQSQVMLTALTITS